MTRSPADAPHGDGDDADAHRARLDELRRKIANGMDAVRRGDVIDGDQVFAEIRERSAARRSG